MKGFFITLEGIDGCGKTTQLKALAEWLPISGLMPPGAELITTREPGGTELGMLLRGLLLSPLKG
jgi:dTMP kinase